MPKVQENAPVSALLKGFAIIEQLSSGALPLGDVARRIGQPKSSVHRLLTTLVDLGVVEQTLNDEYCLTARLFEYGARALDSKNLMSTALPCMQALRDDSGETVHLAVRSGVNAVYLQKVNSSYALRMDSTIGYQGTLYSTSLGKCLMAWMREEEAAILADSIVFRPIMPNTLKNKTELLEHLRQVRSQGFACDNEENESDVICFGAPIFDCFGQVMAAVSVSLPMFRYSPESREQLVHAVQKAAQDISRKFGCAQWPPVE